LGHCKYEFVLWKLVVILMPRDDESYEGL